MSAVFISYRRSDTGGHAGRLYDRLAQWFAKDDIFYDLDAIDAELVGPFGSHSQIQFFISGRALTS